MWAIMNLDTGREGQLSVHRMWQRRGDRLSHKMLEGHTLIIWIPLQLHKIGVCAACVSPLLFAYNCIEKHSVKKISNSTLQQALVVISTHPFCLQNCRYPMSISW